MSSDVHALARTVSEPKSAKDVSANEQQFWNSDPPSIPPILWLTAIHAKWAIQASQRAPVFALQLYHLALASQHCVHHLANEISTNDNGSSLDLSLSQADDLADLIDDLGDCIEAASSQAVANDPSKEEEKLDRIFNGLSALNVAGASAVEGSRAAFQGMRHADWIDIQERRGMSQNETRLTSRQETIHSSRSVERAGSPAPSEGSTDPAQTDREEVNWNTDNESDERIHSQNDENTDSERKSWRRMKVHSDVYLNPRDPPRLQLLQRIQTEEWFLQQTGERTLSAEEAARISGAIEGESVLLGFFYKIPGNYTNDLLLVCTLCMRSIPNPNIYNRLDHARVHMRHHLEQRPITCTGACGKSHCTQRFFTHKDLSAHITGKTEPLAQCDGCGKSLRQKNMDRHVKNYCPVDSRQKPLEGSAPRSSSVLAHPPTITDLDQHPPATAIFSEEFSRIQTPEPSGRPSDVKSMRPTTEGMVSEVNDDQLESSRTGPKSGFRKRLRLMKTSDSPESSRPRKPSSKSQVYNAVSLDLLAADVLPPLKAACRAIKSILEVIQAMEIRQEEWLELAQRLKKYTSALEEQITIFETYPSDERAVNKALRQPLVDYVEFLEALHDEVATLKEKRSHSKLGVFKAFSRTKDDTRQILKLGRDIDHRHRQLMEALRLFIASRIQVIERSTKSVLGTLVDDEMSQIDAAAILQLPTVASFASSIHHTCMPGTREAILGEIQDWAHNDASDQPIFWLCDIAGSGKSTVAMSVAQSWRTEGILGGQFFFSIASTEASTIEKFCPTIARDLAHNMPELAPHIADAVKRHPAVMRLPFNEQFQTLISGPLHHRQERVIFIIDALGECKSAPQRRELVETLSMAVHQNKNLKIFVTSRPDLVIAAAMGALSTQTKVVDRLHDVKYQDNVDDVATYIHQSLSGILSEDKRQRLVNKANGLFIWASTACRMLTDETSLSSPESIYERLISTDQSGAIDDIYDLIFERIDPESYGIMCSVLALLQVAFEPLTTDDLDDILKQNGIPGNINALVQNLGSVLAVNPSTKLIQFRSPTFIEYLRRRSHSTVLNNRTKIYLDIVSAHGQAAAWCFNRLASRTEGLKFNICQVESSFYLNRQIPDFYSRAASFISERLRYASSHWLFHIAETDEIWRKKLSNELKCIIASSCILHWMEILSITRGVPRAIAGLQAFIHSTSVQEEMRSRLIEIRRFIIAFMVPIQDSIPHIYISGLPFTPGTSQLRIEGLKDHQNIFTVTRGLEEEYHGLPATLRGHRYSISAFALSPDGSRIVSDSGENAIRLWDAETGQPLGEPLHGHEGPISAVVFSPNGLLISSASDDKTIRLWDANTGQPLGEPLRGHKRWVSDVAFSPDGSRMVSASGDMTIRLWVVETGQRLGEPLEGHEDSISAVQFSPDGSRIISGSWDKAIRCWDAVTGQPLGEPIRGHEARINCIALSPDGSQIVSGSDDETLRLWDADTGQQLGQPLLGRNGVVTAIAFSPDGSRIVSGSSGLTIDLWETDTGQQLGEPLRGHEGWINAVAFSPDGSQIVSASDDETIRLWDADSGRPLGELIPGHVEQINDVAISSDGSLIVSGSSDKTVRLWDARTGKPSGESLRGHSGVVTAVAISQDGLRIASTSHDKTVRLWDAATGNPLGEPLRGHENSVNAIAFSPDGSQLVSGSSDSTLRLWDAMTGQPLGEAFCGHNGSVKTIAFSPDGLRLVSGSTDCTVRIWEVATGHQIGDPLRGHVNWVNTVKYSPDGSRLASASDDWTIRLWDAATGQPWGEPLQGHEDSVTSLAFSLNGSTIVSGSSDNTIRYWNVATGQLLGGALRGHSGCVNAVLFSPDGSHVISCSSDKTIRVWDADIVAHITTSKHDSEPAESGSGDPSLGTRLRIRVPGFEKCTLSHDGWVQSSDKHLFWVPPDNRHGLQYRHLLTMPTRSPFRATEIDFTNFQCGTSWTKVRGDAME